MSKISTILPLGMLLTTAITAPASAALLYTESFTTALTPAQYQSNKSGVVDTTTDGMNALHFTLNSSGDDLVTNTIAGTGAGTYTLTFDYGCANRNGCGGFVGLFPGGAIGTTPVSSDAWIATDRPSDFPTPFVISFSGGEGFTATAFTFDVDSASPFALKFEDFSGIPGDAYFRNVTLSVAAVPEPATWAMMFLGFGMMGAAMRYRHRGTRTVYA